MQRALWFCAALLPCTHPARVHDSTALPLANTTARWSTGAALQPSFPVGYYLAAGSLDRQCTRGLARFQSLPTWVGSSADERIAALDVLVEAALAPPAQCTLEFGLYHWPDPASPGPQVGAAVAHLVNASLVEGRQSIPIHASAQWVLQPQQWYGLLARGVDGCGGSSAAPYLRLLTVQGPAEGALWPAQYAAGAPCPGGAGSPVADPVLPATQWWASLSTRTALVLRGAEGAPGFPGSATGSYLPLGPGLQTLQLIWERTELGLAFLEVRLSLHGEGNPGVTAFNATLRVQLCYLDTFGDCVGSAGLPTVTQDVVAVIPGGGAPAAATAFELPAGMTRASSTRAALRLSVQSIVASDGSPPPVSGMNTCKLLTCGASAGTTDPALSAVFLADTYAGDGSNFNVNYPGSGPPVPFPCMAVRVVPSDPDVAFPSPTPSVSPTLTPTAAGTPSPSPTGAEGLTASPTGTGTPSASGTPSPTPTSSGSPTPGGGTPAASPSPSPSPTPSPPLFPSPMTSSSAPLPSSSPSSAPASAPASATANATGTPPPSSAPAPDTASAPSAAPLSAGGVAGLVLSLLLLAAVAVLCSSSIALAYCLTACTRCLRLAQAPTKRAPSFRRGSAALTSAGSSLELQTRANPLGRAGIAV